MSNENMRKEFEVWAEARKMRLGRDGVVVDYANPHTDLAWNAWQASREALVIELPPVWEESPNTALGQACAQIRTADIEAIQAAGLKVNS